MLCFTPQVLAEFWSVCTRPPSARGGFGLLPSQAEQRARLIERYFRLLPDSVATDQEWRQLLVRHTVAGVKVHDARLIASMKVYGITHLLTFNAEDFTATRTSPWLHHNRFPRPEDGSARLTKQASSSGRSWPSAARLSPRGMSI
jgi:predicted nucleic acid-binding protein